MAAILGFQELEMNACPYSVCSQPLTQKADGLKTGWDEARDSVNLPSASPPSRPRSRTHMPFYLPLYIPIPLLYVSIFINLIKNQVHINPFKTYQ